MTSVRKRKRGTLEAVEISKRAKSVPDGQDSAPELDASKVGWDSTSGDIRGSNDVVAKGNGDVATCSINSLSAETEDYQDLVQRNENAKAKNGKRTAEPQVPEASTWKISDAIGGRMLEVDPVFTENEKFLIVAQRKTILVYSTSNSLLNRSIKLSIDKTREPLPRIIAYSLSSTSSNILWVACSDGSVFKLDWTSGEGGERSWKTSSTGTNDMAIASIASADRLREVIFTTELYHEIWRISAHEMLLDGISMTSSSRVIYTSTQAIQFLKIEEDGTIITAASENSLLIGNLRSIDFGIMDKIKYEFRVFDSSDPISSLDVRVSKRELIPRKKPSAMDKTSVVDVVVGDVKGAIFVHNDLLRNLIRSLNSADGQYPINIIPRKLHWHRKAVHSVKWSLDGNYIISGGSETVLVLWQLDTGRQQYLPHLSATIQNIVVSPSGTFYAVHLADNSTMVISTTELKPTANIAGIQANVIESSLGFDSLVRRITAEVHAKPVVPRTPAVVNPACPQKLLLAVGDIQDLNPNSGLVAGAPFLQTFDIASDHNLSRQAMTRTNITNRNIAPSAHRISEALLSHLQISHDGTWLATVDEWVPPKHDIEFLGRGGVNLEDEQRRRREVYLKFWQWNKTDDNWGLVTRIDAPHTMAVEKYGAGRVLALATDSSTLAFSTLGEDAVAQIWRPRTRKRDGVLVRGQDGDPLFTWSCHKRAPLGLAGFEEDGTNARKHIPSHACLAYSEDGSILAAALNGQDDRAVHLIDPMSGTIRSSISIMYQGDLLGISLLGKYLIVLSDDLRVYDLVVEEQIYRITLGDAKSILSLEQKTQMIHLATDRKSHTFAVAIPRRGERRIKAKKSSRLFPVSYSELVVFDPQHPAPLFTHCLSSLATALIPAISSPGFLVLDATAEMSTVSPKASQTLSSQAKPVVELRLDIRGDDDEQPAIDLLSAVENADDNDDDANSELGIEAQVRADLDETATTLPLLPEVDDDGPPVVTQHQLAEVLDIGPSFALPPIEEMFYHIADLFSRKPALAQRVA